MLRHPWLTLATFVALAVLIGLGIWQLQRRQEKQALIAALDARAAAAPVALDTALAAFRVGSGEYVRVAIEGRYLHAYERHLYALDGGTQGYHVMTPFLTEAGASASRVVFVNRGFVPADRKEAPTRTAGQTTGRVSIVGLVRSGARKAWFDPDNEPGRNIWYWRDLDGLGRSLPADVTAQAPLLPFIVDLESPPAPQSVMAVNSPASRA
mgnify:FL=1